MTKPLDQMIADFFREFPALKPTTHIINPTRKGAFEAANRWISDRLKDEGLDGRAMQRVWSGTHRHIREGVPHYYGVPGLRDKRLAANIINPACYPLTWADRVERQVSDYREQHWARPDRQAFEALDHAYGAYTFHHETGHAIEHSLPKMLTKRPARHTSTTTALKAVQSEPFADIRGSLGLIRELPAADAIETMRRLAHLRSIAAIHHGDTEHLTTRGFRTVLGRLARHQGLEAWQKPGQAGAQALMQNLPEISFTAENMESLDSLNRAIMPGDTFSAEVALATVSGIGESTPDPTVYELARDYVEAVAALVPADRYEASSLTLARLNLRRNPIAKAVDAAQPRIETLAAQARQAFVSTNDAKPAPGTKPAPPLRRAGL